MAAAQPATPDYPPHILNHIAQWDAAKHARSTSLSIGTSPSGPSDGSQQSSTSPFFDFLKLHTSRNKGDGDKPRRRGPKPDSKPALTRKQELNRQAQRTHRERKEKYVCSLEEDVARLREAFTIITKEKTQILQENRRLKEILELHGIVYNPDGEYGQRSPPHRQYQQQQTHHRQMPGTSPSTGPSSISRSYDEIGIDFVLALERPCMEHMTPLTTNSVNNPEADFHGHALMISCPPESHNMQHPNVNWEPPKNLDLQTADLSVLFHLSRRLQLGGEMTPIAVWATIARHERFAELDLDDFEMVKQELLPKVKCHGFGAIVEEFEVSDVLSRLFANKHKRF